MTTMFVYGSLVVFAAALQIILAQGPQGFEGQECHRPPPVVERPFDCCKLPPFFEAKDFEECGFEKREEGEGPPQGPPGPPPPPPDEMSKEIVEEPNQNLDGEQRRHKFTGKHRGRHPFGGHNIILQGWRGGRNCTKQLCLLKKYGMVNEDDIDKDGVIKFLDTYEESNPDFKDAIAVVKEHCVGKDLPGPPHICEANKMMFCMSHSLFSYCPTWQDTEGCKTLKAHMEKCEKFFPPKH